MKTVVFALLSLLATTFALADKAFSDALADPAATAAFEPGTHGEPFTVNALVQGCVSADEGDFCVFYAEGARWTVPQGDPSNRAALDILANAPVNAPFIITGDMLAVQSRHLVDRVEDESIWL